ncbi:hypothetical protein ACAG24_024290 [Mycobacterium sp. pW049]|uniref:hypothetical protein n=1 Tax=[Mycobacterium] bulgaricum TaxID=3238985 RepID=UPI00351B4021
MAVTREHVDSGNPPVVPGGRNTSWEFEPTAFSHGGRMAFAIAVTRNSAIPRLLDPSETVIKIADRWDRLTLLYVWMTEAGVTLDASGRLLDGPLPLASGRQVWVTCGEEPVDPSPPEPPPAGQIVEPRFPGEHDVRAPGFIVRGLNIG